MPVTLRSKSLRVKNEQEETPPKRRAQTKVEIPEDNEKPLRNVEEIRRKNLEDNKAFLEGLLMTQIRDDFKSLTNTLQPAKKRDIKYVTVTENIPVRRSRRLAHMDINGNKLPSPEVSDNEMDTTDTHKVIYQQKTRRRITEISPEEQEILNEKIKTFFEDKENVLEQNATSDYEFTDLNVLDENVLKLTPERLISMDIHSRSDIVAIIGCDRRGVVGLVVKSSNEINGGWSKINYNFHTQYATCCRFDNVNLNCINSTAYDGTFRTCDITKNTSIEILQHPDDHGLTSFDYRSSQTCLISSDKGEVLVVDFRADPMPMERFNVTKKRTRTLHINPSQTDEFCIAGGDNCVKIWDLRNMSSTKYCLTTNHSCYGAYYNQAGSHLVATTRDDYLMSFSLDEMSKAKDPLDVSPMKKVHHRNYVNRFVTPFTAQPNARFESFFLIGSHGYPREISVLDENCKTIGSLRSENLNSLATVNLAHKTLPIVVGGNSSGRIHVFTGDL